jgi:hypothetical protein
MQGTSQATPLVAGAANILIQAMGGYANWAWNRTQALQPKMLLLMTATETYPNIREQSTSTYSPTLDRGGKDPQEGYGRINLDAAVDAITKTYQVGSTATASLSNPPALTDISTLGQPLDWARNVQLASGFTYSFTLNVPSSSDYDLYVYNSTGTSYGEPAIIAKSTTAATGGTEQVQFKAPYTGTYYVVVKRATETTASGTFTLTSTGPVFITLNSPGLTNATNVIHYTENGTIKTGNITSNTFSDYADSGTTLQIDNPIYATTLHRFLTNDPTSFAIQTATTLQVRYTEQFWIQINSTHDAPQPSQWTNTGTIVPLSVNSPADVDGNGTRYECTGWTGTGDIPTTGSTTMVSFTLSQPSNITWNWKTQHLLNVTSNISDPNLTPIRNPIGENGPPNDYWYDSTTTTTLTAQTPSGYAFTNWDIDNISQNSGLTQISVNMNTPHNATAHYLYDQTLTLNSGWNMVSFPVLPSDTSFASIFSSVAGYSVYGWSGTSYTIPSNAQAGVGYWVFVPTQTTLDLKSTQPTTSYSANLASGWTIIGSVYGKTVSAGSVFDPNPYTLYTWTGTNYASSTTIEPGKAYWAFVSAPTNIIVS